MKRTYTRGPAVTRAIEHVVIEPNGCWTYDGAHTPAGYAHMNLGDRRYGHVDRVLYEHFVGPIPQGLELDHLCRNRACVNPAHVEPVTHLENVRRGAAAFSRQTGRCRRGHVLAEHGYERPDGRGWNCNECRRLRREGQIAA